MKFLCTGDWHLRLKKPKLRKDKDYLQTQKDKISWILNFAQEEEVDCILQPGDFFDSDTTPYFVLREFINLFKTYKKDILTTPGQHDLRYHTKRTDNIPLGLVETSGHVLCLTSKKPYCFDGVNVYAAGWGEEIPKIKNPDEFNILITHRMIIKREKLWSQQDSYVRSNSLLRKSGFDLIVSGDNHKHFIDKHEDSVLINCGSLLRTSISQEKHLPCVYIFDTDDLTLDKHLIPVLKHEEIFNQRTCGIEKNRNRQLEAFIQGLNDSEIKTMDSDYVDNVYNLLLPLKDCDELKILADEIFANYYDSNSDGRSNSYIG